MSNVVDLFKQPKAPRKRKEKIVSTEYKNRSRPGAARMTRAHFEAIAETLRGLKPAGGWKTKIAVEQWKRTVEDFAGLCAANHKSTGYAGFDRERFYRACGMEE